MFRFISLLVLISSVFLFAGQKLTVAVPLAPYAKIVRMIANDENVDVVTLVPSNANPHAYEPKPAVLKQFTKASIYFSDESGLDKAWMPRFKGVNPNVKIVNISSGVSFIKEDEDEHEEHAEHGHHHDLDPHLWNSPRQVILLASNICSALVDADPMNAGTYRANLERFNLRMSKMDMEFTNKLSKLPADKRTFIVFHPSYGYLARDYGLKQIAVEMDGKEPKPRDLAHLVKEAKEHHVTTIYVQPQFSKRAAESLARETNAKIVFIDPLNFEFDAMLTLFVNSLVGEEK